MSALRPTLQKLNRTPVSIRLPGKAAVAWPKKGEVCTPENPIGLTWLKTFVA